MSIVRRFLVIQALLLWQGGFLFYATVVVPVGSRLLGSWVQGTVTRHVTDWMNAIGACALVVLAWDQWATADASCRRLRWLLWSVMAVGLVGLAVVHSIIAAHLDSSAADFEAAHARFYELHRVYLFIAGVQWLAGLAYVFAALRAWNHGPRGS